MLTPARRISGSTERKSANHISTEEWKLKSAI